MSNAGAGFASVQRGAASRAAREERGVSGVDESARPRPDRTRRVAQRAAIADLQKRATARALDAQAVESRIVELGRRLRFLGACAGMDDARGDQRDVAQLFAPAGRARFRDRETV